MFRNASIFIPIILASLIFGWGEQSSAFFIFSREGLANWELWRVLSGFLVHFSAFHLVSNLILFTVLGLYLKKSAGALTLLKLLLSLALITSLCLMLFSTEMLFYGGLSAINYGLFAYVVISFPFTGGRTFEHKYRTGFSLVVLAVILSHIFFQSYTAESLLSFGHTNESVVIAWQSHLYGVLAAIGFGIIRTIRCVFTHISIPQNEPSDLHSKLS